MVNHIENNYLISGSTGKKSNFVIIIVIITYYTVTVDFQLPKPKWLQIIFPMV